MASAIIIHQPPTGDDFQAVGRCWNFNAVFDASVQDASVVDGKVKCELKEVDATIKKGSCMEFECPFNSMHYLPPCFRH